MAIVISTLAKYGSDIIIYNPAKHPVFDIKEADKDKVYINGIKVGDIIEYNVPYEKIVTTAIVDTSTFDLQGVGTVYNVPMYDADATPRPESSYSDSNDSSLWIDERANNAPALTVSLYSDLEDVTSKLADFSVSAPIDDYFHTIYFVHIESNDSVNFKYGYDNDDNGNPLYKRNDVYYYPDPNEKNYYNLDRCDKFTNEDASYSLLRCNPKLTGNVKVVVDSSSNLFLDTFKVSKTLSQQKYRKIKLNPEEYYGRSLMTHYNSVPSTDLYKVEDSCYDIFSLSNSLGDEYYDKYNYGVRTNSDKMYSENYSLLAPLCIKKNMPDFFLIFKIKNYTGETDPSERLKYFLKNGEIVKCYDMRQDSNLGKFVRKVYEQSKDFVGDIFVSYDYNKNNVYNGISLERGVVAEIYESASLERNLKSQVDMNNWYTLGFERNRILSKDIINFEFMFDDPSEEMFSLNTYFGLYVRLNGEQEDFSCIGNTGTVNVFDSSISGTNYNPSSYPEIIYGFSDKNVFHRLSENISVSKSILPYKLSPDENIASPKIIKDISKDYANKTLSYVSLTLKEPLEVGEHYNIIDNSTSSVYEVIISDSKNENLIGLPVVYKTENGFTIHRISIHNMTYKSLMGGWDDELLNSHASLLKDAMKILTKESDKNAETYSNGNKVSIVFISDSSITNKNLVFEKVTSSVGFTADEKEYISTYEEDCFDFYGASTGTRTYLSNDSGLPYFPHGFEHLGDRVAYISDFINISPSSSGFNYIIDKDLNSLFKPHKSVLYRTDDKEPYALYEKLKYEKFEYQSIDGFGEGNVHFISLKVKPLIFNERIHFYSSYPINAGVCSIFPIYDIDTYVQDTNSRISESSSDSTLINRDGEFSSPLNVTESSILKTSQEEYFSDYIDLSQNYNPSPGLPLYDTDRNKFYKKMLNGNHKKSDIPLMSNYCCKWESVGTSYTGKPLRVMYSMNTSLDNKSYFIAQDSSAYVGLVTVDLSKTIDEGSECKYVHDYGIPYKYKNFIKNLERGNLSLDYLVSGLNSRFSKAYSLGNNALEFISGGAAINIKSNNTNIFNPAKYNNYSAILVCSGGTNTIAAKTSSIFIDEIKKQIAVTYYNGTSSDKMYYKSGNGDNSDTFPNVTRAFRTSPISSASVNSQNADCTYASVKDDAKYLSSERVINTEDEFDYQWFPTPIGTNSYLVMSSPEKNDYYTKETYNFLSLLLSEDVVDEVNNFIKGEVTTLTKGGIRIRPTQANFTNYFYKKNEYFDSYIISQKRDAKGKGGYPLNTFTFSELGELFSSFTIKVKSEDGIKDFSNLPNLLSITVKSPILFKRENENYEVNENVSGSVYPSYVQFVKTPILKFKSESSINNEFNKDFTDCNLTIDELDYVPQLWLKKYSSQNVNVFDSSGTISLGIFPVKQINVVNDFWETKFLRTYTSSSEFSTQNGMASGYEKNSFLASRGLSLKNKNSNKGVIELTKWRGVSLDKESDTITLDVTDTLINFILNLEGYAKNWIDRNIEDSKYKIKYIENSIIPYINLENNHNIEILRVSSPSTGFSSFEDAISDSNYTALSNAENELYKENDKYFIRINKAGNYTYALKMTIKI